MTITMNKSNYNAQERHILAFPDHYVAIAHTFCKDDYLAKSVTLNGVTRKIVKAGTWVTGKAGTTSTERPAVAENKVLGIALHDYDVTDGDVSGAVVIHGFVLAARSQTAVTTTNRAYVPGITFLPLANDPAWTGDVLTLVKPSAKLTSASASTAYYFVVQLANGVGFTSAATTTTNWTVTNSSGTIDSVVFCDSDGNELPDAYAVDEQVRKNMFVKIKFTTAATVIDTQFTAAAACSELGVASSATTVIDV